MRHLKKGRKLKRTASHRKALLSNLATSLFKSESKRIRTTLAKAKEARKLVDQLITKAKRASVDGIDNAKVVHAKREIYKVIRDRNVISNIFTEVVPKVKERPGGYTRVVKIGQRLGDAAEMAILELVDFNIAQDKEATSKKEKEVEETAQKDTKETAEKPAKKTRAKKSEKTEKTEKTVKETNKDPKKTGTRKKKEETKTEE